MDYDPIDLRRHKSNSATMTKVFNRIIVQKYLHHKLSKKGHVWRFDCGDDDADDGPETDGSPLLYKQQPDPRASVHRVLREAGEELERLYQSDFTDMSRRLYLTSATARARFSEVIDELFRDGVNWGRIIAFFEFGGTVCVECASKEDMTSQVDLIAEWMTEYLNGPRLNSWILDNGGWDTFVELYDRQRDSVFNCSWPSIKTVFGLAALGAASLTIGAYLAQK
ncbi:apoptosis regulator Bcl-2 [Synchiropus picturatus]